jgi:hypothetical protein
VSFSDQFACLEGIAELVRHVDAARRHLPGVALAADGPLRVCQATALLDWAASAADGKIVMRGTNVFVFDACGAIERVVGLPR